MTKTLNSILARWKTLRITVFIDGWCAVCKRFAKSIKYVDIFDLVEIKDIRNQESEDTGIDIEKGLKIMASKTATARYYGFDSLFQIIKRIPILWIFLPFFLLLDATGFGDIFYNEIAIKRKIIPIQCNRQCSIDPKHEDE